MQTLEQIAQIADGFYDRLYDRNTSSNLDARIEAIKDDTIEDEDVIQELVMDGSFIDAEQFWVTIRALANANMMKNENAVNALAKSLALDIEVMVGKYAEWKAAR